jgi:gliding motility-associated-like protein
MKKILLFILVFSASHLFSQDYSNKGKEFWIAYSAHVDATSSLMGIYLTSDLNASGTIKVGNTNVPFTITANQVTRVILGTSGAVATTNTTVYLDMQDGIKQNAGIKITSNVPIVVYAHIIRSARSAATLVLPTPVLGTEYIVPGHPSTGNASGGGANGELPFFSVVATQSNTTIEFTPTANGLGGKQAGQTYQVTLANAGDCYQFQGIAKSDISGTVVRSVSTATTGCKPIAVFAGSTWAAFDCNNASGGDNLYQELFPVRSWGKQFITAPFIFRPADIFRIYVKDPSTIVKYTENGVTTTFNVNQLFAGNFYQIKTANPVFIEANNPISVVQFMTSLNCKSGCQTGGGFATKSCAADPEMIILNPIEQTLRNITFFSAHQSSFTGFNNITNVENHYVNVIIDRRYKGSVRIDNALPRGAFVDIVGTNYSYLQEDVTNSSATNPVHNVKADTGFSAIVYGTGNVESYGYNGGTNVVDLYQYISLKNEYATVNFPATCKNTPFNFSITLPYQPLKLNWDFGGTTALSPNNNIINNNPVADSTFIKDGRNLYVYKIPSTYSFNQTGTYPIKVIVNNPTSDGCGGEQEIVYDVQVLDPPSPPSFTTNSNGCVFSPIQFSSVSSAAIRPIIKYLWDFGDATRDSIATPTKTYNTSGSFSVSHRVINDIGCVADTVKTLRLNTPPTAKFLVDTNVCVGQNVVVTDSSFSAFGGNITRWFWDNGDGKKDTLLSSSNRTYSYNDFGKKTITLIVETSSGCRSGVFEKEVWVRRNPEADFTLPTVVCLPKGNATFINQSHQNFDTSNLTYEWNFGNGDSSVLRNGFTTFVASSTYTIKLVTTNQFGCKAEKISTLNNIQNSPIANFIVKKEACLRDTTFLQDSSYSIGSNVNSWRWIFSDNTFENTQNTFRVYASPIIDTIKLVVENDKGCISDTIRKVTTINALPTAGFVVSNVTCEKQNIFITDTSKANAGTLISWNYSFGNDSIKNYSTNPSPIVYKYNTAGVYTIRSQVTNSKGCISDGNNIYTITIYPKPNVNFGTPEVCLDDAFAQFTDSSSIPNNSTLNYLWNFNDKNANLSNPNFSLVQSPRHSYTDTGVYSVKLVVTSLNNCVDSLAKNFTVNGSTPKSVFTVLNPNNLCSNDSVRIMNNSSVDFGSITKLEVYWDTTSNSTKKTVDENPLPNKVYATVYDKFSLPASKFAYIKVVVYSGETCRDSSIQRITLVQAPTVQFLPLKSICKEANARVLTEASEINGLAGTSTFSGLGISNSSTGLYNPSLVSANTTDSIKYVFTTNVFGCKDSATQSIFVIPTPAANFTVSSPLCEKSAITFSSTATSTIGKIIQWNWYFNSSDSLIKTDSLPVSNIYAIASAYNVVLRVITDSGCTNNASKPITINALPKVNFQVNENICLPLGRALFRDSSMVASTDRPLQYFWNFNVGKNNASSIMNNPIHFYAYADTPNPIVKLIITTAKGCVDSATKTISKLLPQPKAKFKVLPDSVVCISNAFNTNLLSFIDESDGKTSAIKNWNWSFGRLGVSNVKNPNYSFSDSGFVPVKLFVQNNQECISDTAIIKIKVNTYPKIELPKQLSFLEGGLLTIKPTKFYAINPQFKWYLNQRDIVNDSILQAQVFPQNDKRFKLSVIGEGACISEDTVYVIVLRMPSIPTAFSPNGDMVNDLWEIQHLDSYPGSTVQVFDRFGRMVYQSTLGYAKPWNGKLFNIGSDLPIGTYYYIIDPKNGRKQLSGSITILR